jgi:hypothetical protein
MTFDDKRSNTDTPCRTCGKLIQGSEHPEQPCKDVTRCAHRIIAFAEQLPPRKASA